MQGSWVSYCLCFIERVSNVSPLYSHLFTVWLHVMLPAGERSDNLIMFRRLCNVSQGSYISGQTKGWQSNIESGKNVPQNLLTRNHVNPTGRLFEINYTGSKPAFCSSISTSCIFPAGLIKTGAV